MSIKKDRKLLDEVREVMRLRHYSIHTERTYCNWIKRFVLFHKMVSREDLKDGEAKIEEFLTHQVSALQADFKLIEIINFCILFSVYISFGPDGLLLVLAQVSLA